MTDAPYFPGFQEFDHRLDDELAPGEVVEGGREPHPRVEGVVLVLGDLAARQRAARGPAEDLPAVLDTLGVETEKLAPGQLVVVHHRRGKVAAVERH